MRAFTVAAALGALLMSATTYAQNKPAPTAPPTAAPKPAPQAPPAKPAPTPPPAAAAAPPVVPFPDGAKIAYVDIQRIVAESVEGKAAQLKVKALNDKKVAELNEKNKALQSDQAKLQAGGTVLSDAARDDLQRKIERADTDIQRATQDAQKELQDLQATLQIDFNNKLAPIITEVATEKSLHMVFDAANAGLAWAHLGLDITADVIKRFDAATKK